MAANSEDCCSGISSNAMATRRPRLMWTPAKWWGMCPARVPIVRAERGRGLMRSPRTVAEVVMIPVPAPRRPHHPEVCRPPRPPLRTGFARAAMARDSTIVLTTTRM